MSVAIQDLQQASYRFGTGYRGNLKEAIARGIQTAFLCHSHKDQALAKGLQVLLGEHGWNLYIDWDDAEMPAKPDRNTARRLQDKVRTCDWFLYLATPNSSSSRWCPWEIGYANGVKGNIERILVVATHSDGHTYGAEYLELYRQVSPTTAPGWAVFEAGSSQGGVSVRNMTP